MVKVSYDSDEAAEIKTVTGWFSRNGHFYGENEHLARWGGCTHKTCDCGNEMSRSWTKCDVCRKIISDAAFAAMPEVAYNDQPVVIYGSDRYFFCIEDIEQFCEDEDLKIEDLQLVACVPNMACRVSIDDMWCDDLPEDTYAADVAPEIAELEAKMNTLIQEGITLSWSQGKHKVII